MIKTKKKIVFLTTCIILFGLFATNVYAGDKIVITETINETFPVALGQEIEVTVTIENRDTRGYSFNLSTLFGKQTAVEFIDGSVTLDGESFTQYDYTLVNDGINKITYRIDSIAANSTATLTFYVKALTSSKFYVSTSGGYAYLSGLGGGAITRIRSMFSVVYYPNGGSGTGPMGGDFAANDEFNASVNTYDAPDGYKFVSWNMQSDGTGVIYNEDDKITMSNENLDLYAMWEKDEETTSAETSSAETTSSGSTISGNTKPGNNNSGTTSAEPTSSETASPENSNYDNTIFEDNQIPLIASSDGTYFSDNQIPQTGDPEIFSYLLLTGISVVLVAGLFVFKEEKK